MKNLKRLIAAVALASLLGLAAFAGETQTPPCAPPQPGETQTPPCSGQMASDNSGTVSTQPVQGTESAYLFTEVAVNVIESLLLY